MKKSGRYDVSGIVEAQYEPGSKSRVLKNFMGIRNKRAMDIAEAREQVRVMETLVRTYDQNHRFTSNDICKIHELWLGSLYPWAGRYRQVNLSKGNFPFPPAAQVSRLMEELERGPLHKYTPCLSSSREEISESLAVVHTEFVLIHPFRDGNGRVGRILSILMALQAGLPPLDFGGIRGIRRQEYFAAVRAGLEQNYNPMARIFDGIISRTLRTSGKK